MNIELGTKLINALVRRLNEDLYYTVMHGRGTKNVTTVDDMYHVVVEIDLNVGESLTYATQIFLNHDLVRTLGGCFGVDLQHFGIQPTDHTITFYEGNFRAHRTKLSILVGMTNQLSDRPRIPMMDRVHHDEVQFPYLCHDPVRSNPKMLADLVIPLQIRRTMATNIFSFIIETESRAPKKRYGVYGSMFRFEWANSDREDRCILDLDTRGDRDTSGLPYRLEIFAKLVEPKSKIFEYGDIVEHVTVYNLIWVAIGLNTEESTLNEKAMKLFQERLAFAASKEVNQ